MYRPTTRLAAILAAAGVLATGGTALAADHRDARDAGDPGFSATLTGYEEVPAVSTDASGTFQAWLDHRDKTLHWQLTYRDLEADATQAHVHFGQRSVNGGVSLFLCSNLNDAPRGTQACPDRSARLTGTAEADDVVGPAAQGIDPGEFDELVAAMGAGVTYANVHSEDFPNGEIRGQISPDDRVANNDRHDRNDPDKRHEGARH